MSKLDQCPNCHSQRLIDISGEYSGWETVSDRLQKCCECGKCWGYSKSRVVDFTKQFDDVVGDALAKAVEKLLNDEFPEQQK